MGKYLKVKEVAAEARVDQAKPLGWIRTGELRAIDISERRGGRPRWRIPLEAWEEFKRARSNVAAIAPRQTTKKGRKEPDVINFY